MTAVLNGLVLSGGRSRRMQRDKAALEYSGVPQLARALALLEPLVPSTFVSVRADQLNDPQRSSHPCIVDQTPDAGPIGGILAALHAQPRAAWLVLACDLPFLDSATLQQLIAGRDPHRLATAFLSSHDRKPEPLCAIYEPASLAAMESWVASGQKCPRGFLAQANVALLTLRSARALDNVNTPAEYDTARAVMHADVPRGPPRSVRVRYFAVLREQAGRSEEQVSTGARDARELYEELRAHRGLRLRAEQLRVAINEEFADWSQALAEGDSVVFLPPVAGG